MRGTTTGKDTAKTFVNHFEERGIDIRTDKIFSVTTDSAPAVVGKHGGFVKIVENQIGHPTLNFHCIIHQQNLCAKISNSGLNNVMTTVVKIMIFFF